MCSLVGYSCYQRLAELMLLSLLSAAIWLRKEVRKRRRAAINEFVRASPSFEAILSVWDAHNAVSCWQFVRSLFLSFF